MLHAELTAWQGRWDAAAEAVGFDRMNALEIAAWAAQTDMSEALFTMPAASLAGIEAKLAVLVALCETGAADPEFPSPQLRSTLADVKRLRRESDPSRR